MFLVQTSVLVAVLSMGGLAYFGMNALATVTTQSSAKAIAYSLAQTAGHDIAADTNSASTMTQLATSLTQQQGSVTDKILLQTVDGKVVLSTDSTDIGKAPNDAASQKALQATADKPVFQIDGGRFEHATAVVVNGKVWGVVRVQGPISVLRGELATTGWVTLAVIAIIVIGSGLITRRRAGRLVLPLRELSAQAERIGVGDLSVTVAVKGEDEVARLGTAFNSMTAKVRELLAGIQEAGDYVVESSRRLAEGASDAAHSIEHLSSLSNSVNDRANQQAEDTANASSVVRELTQAVGQIASGAEEQAGGMTRVNQLTAQMMDVVKSIHLEIEEVSAAAKGALQAAGEGQGAMSDSNEGMERITQAVSVVAQQMEQLHASTDRINEVISLIGEVAEQTNLLALNAAIEAARAGEAGKGFAVVAEEVRRLASRTQNAAGEVTSLVEAIQKGTSEVLAAVERGNAEVREGTALSGQAAQAFSQIVTSVRETEQRASNILRDARNLAESSGQVQDAIATVAAVAEENSAAAEEMSAGSQEVAGLIEDIRTMSAQTHEMVGSMASDTQTMAGQAEEIAATAEAMMESAHQLQALARRFKV
jgi:methyl-accepting chemotaxis protein